MEYGLDFSPSLPRSDLGRFRPPSFFSPAYEELTIPSWRRPNNWEMTVYTVYMAAMVVCLVAILIVFELIDQRPVRQRQSHSR